MAELDLKKLNETYQKETGQKKPEAQKTAQETQAALGIGGFDKIDDIADTFCDAWPQAMKLFNWAFIVGAWVPGMASIVVMAKGVIAAIDKNMVPVVCAAAGANDATSSAADPNTRRETRPMTTSPNTGTTSRR